MGCSMLEQELPTRMELLTDLAWLKREIKLLLIMRSESAEVHRSISRAKRKLEAQGSPFNRRKIEALSAAMEIHPEVRKKINDMISFRGMVLVDLCHSADQLLSGHDKAQILGISHIRFRRILEEVRSVMKDGETPIGLFSLIHTCQAEHRHEYLDFPDQASLWEAARLAMLRLMEENAELRETMSEAAGEWLREMGVPMYQRTVGADGQERLERMPPTLKVVH